MNSLTVEHLAQKLIDARCVLESPSSTQYAIMEAAKELIQLAELNRLKNMSKARPDHQLN